MTLLRYGFWLVAFLSIAIGGVSCRVGYRLCYHDFECDDQNACTVDICQSKRCSNQPVPGCLSCDQDSDCDDGLFCNGPESCQAGACSDSVNPCGPRACDEDNDRCASCGDGVVNNAEQCDPAPPRSDHCCDPATCNRVPPQSLDPQGICSGPGECSSEVCTIAGNCRFLDINEGSLCTSDGLYCTGIEQCSGGLCVSAGDPCLPRACYDDVDACSQDVWYGLGGSEFGSWTQTVGGSTWGGGVSQSYSSAMGPRLALNSDGHPVLVWTVAAFADFDVYARRFNGFDWEEIGAGSHQGGGISQSVVQASTPWMALDDSGNPVVAWKEYIGGQDSEIYVKRFDGLEWVEVGAGSASGSGISPSPGHTYAPSLDLDGSGNPAVAWYTNESGNHEIHVRRFNGTNWEDVGPGSSTAGGISDTPGDSLVPRLAVTTGGDPVVAWIEDVSGSQEVWLKRFNGADWVELAGSATDGGLSASPGNSMTPVVVVEESGNPVVAWVDDSFGSNQIYLKRFNGTGWEEVGSGSASGAGISEGRGEASAVSVVLDPAGNPLVAWADDFSEESQIYLRRFDGSSGTWEEIAGSGSGLGISMTLGSSAGPSLALDPDGNPVVAWSDVTPGTSQIFIKRFDGTGWVPIGPEFGSGGGISENPTSSIAPALVLDDSGNPTVAWMDGQVLTGEIYVKTLQGPGWVEVGPGSASGGGMSDTGGRSQYLDMDLDSAGNPVVVWSEDSMSIYLKRFNGTNWEELDGSATAGGLHGSPEFSLNSRVVVDDEGNPIVAWEEWIPFSFQIFVKRYDGTSWVELGSQSAQAGGVSNTARNSWGCDLLLDTDGNPVVAWQEDESGNNEIYLKRFNGANWEELDGSASPGGISANAGASYVPALALDGAGSLVVSWTQESAGILEIYVKRFNEASGSWEEMGAGSASGTGISANQPGPTSVYWRSHMARDQFGDVAILWPYQFMGRLDLYVKRFDGVEWVEVGAGSAQAGGVSNSTTPPIGYSLAAGGGRICVAWSEGGPVSTEILMRCSDE